MKKFVFLLCISLISLQSVGQVKQIVKKKYYGGKFNEQDTTAGYSEAVLVDNTLYISGWIGRGTIAEQLQEIYSNLGSILAAFGASYQNVVKETLFTTEIEGVKNNNSVRKAFYKGDFPAATWVQITRLYSARADAQIEVELIAHLQNSKK